MRRHQHKRRRHFSSDSEEESETEEALKREIDDLKSKVNFLRLLSINTPCCSSDVVLVATGSSDSADSPCSSPPIPAHRAVLMSHSPVFRAMLENKKEESLSSTIKISDVSYDALHAFINYLYTADVLLDEIMAGDLLVLAEKYQVMHLKSYCEKHLVSRLNLKNSLAYYAFAHQYAAESLLDAALSLIMDNMYRISKQEEYLELLEKDPRVLVEIYEAHLSKRVNTAANQDPKRKA